jgi:FAD/FMN-containing dehydrogenase
MDIVFDPMGFEIMKGIKKAFDPNKILNDGKIF